MKCILCIKDTETNFVDEMKKLYKEYGLTNIDDDVIVCPDCFIKRKREVIAENIYRPALDTFMSRINKMGYDYDGVETDAFLQEFTRTHRYLQSEAFAFLITFLKKYAALSDDCFDQRNEWTKNWAKKASETF